MPVHEYRTAPQAFSRPPFVPFAPLALIAPVLLRSATNQPISPLSIHNISNPLRQGSIARSSFPSSKTTRSVVPHPPLKAPTSSISNKKGLTPTVTMREASSSYVDSASPTIASWCWRIDGLSEVKRFRRGLRVLGCIWLVRIRKECEEESFDGHYWC